MDEDGREIAVLGEGWTDIQVFSKGDVIWWWDPVCGENPLQPGTHQCRTPTGCGDRAGDGGLQCVVRLRLA